MPTHHLQAILIVILALAIMAASFAAAWAALTPKGRLTCAEFRGSHEDAVDAFKRGATHLDGDKDGIPCEGLITR